MHDAFAYLGAASQQTSSSSSSSAAATANAAANANAAATKPPPASKEELISPFSNQARNRVKAENNPKRRPTKAWERMHDKFKAHIDAKGTTVVYESDNAALFKWIRQQEIEYKNLLDGKGSSMFQSKIDKLQHLGFKFEYISVQDRYTMLIKFKEENGHYNVPSTLPVLDKWIEKQRSVAKKFAKGDSALYFDMRFKEFAALGIYTGTPEVPSEPLTEDEKLSREHDDHWHEYFDKIVEYKRQRGHLDVSPEDESSLQLANWVKRQHQEYQKIQEGKPSKFTLARVQKLTDIGFVFQQRKQSVKWEDRMKQLQHYKEKHGKVKVPKSDLELGVFVNRQRYEYTKLMAGKPSSLNTERMNELKALDFVFQAGKTPKSTQKKGWDERHQELARYKEQHGHVNVPQQTPGLGEWVHSQRAYYKKLKQGKSSPLTPERLLMLANLGFLFDATKKRGQIESYQNAQSSNATMEFTIDSDGRMLQAPLPPHQNPLQHVAVAPVLQNQLADNSNIGHLVTAMLAPAPALPQYQPLNDSNNGVFDPANGGNLANPEADDQEASVRI